LCPDQLTYKILGPITKKQNDWFNENLEEIKELVTEKYDLYKAIYN
jgi:hypothetical protein